MIIPIKFAELHTMIFVGGRSLGPKLAPAMKSGLKLVYDRTEKELLVTIDGETAIVPVGNLACMIPVPEKAKKA